MTIWNDLLYGCDQVLAFGLEVDPIRSTEIHAEFLLFIASINSNDLQTHVGGVLDCICLKMVCYQDGRNLPAK